MSNTEYKSLTFTGYKKNEPDTNRKFTGCIPIMEEFSGEAVISALKLYEYVHEGMDIRIFNAKFHTNNGELEIKKSIY